MNWEYGVMWHCRLVVVEASGRFRGWIVTATGYRFYLSWAFHVQGRALIDWSWLLHVLMVVQAPSVAEFSCILTAQYTVIMAVVCLLACHVLMARVQ